MAQDADEIRVGANGDVYVAPSGTTEPADQAAALDAAFTSLGLLTPEGVKLAQGRTNVDIRAWQSKYPVRRIESEGDFQLSGTMLQWSGANFVLAFGGGTVTEPVPASGNYRYDPPAPEVRNVVVAVVEYVDGLFTYRIVVPRCSVGDNVESDIMRTDAAKLPFTLSIEAPAAGASPWYVLTDDPAFTP